MEMHPTERAIAVLFSSKKWRNENGIPWSPGVSFNEEEVRKAAGELPAVAGEIHPAIRPNRAAG